MFYENQCISRSQGPEFEPLPAVELTPGGVDSACHRSEVSEMSTSVLVIIGPCISGTAAPSANDAATRSLVLHMKEEEEEEELINKVPLEWL